MNLLLTSDNDLAVIDGDLPQVTGSDEIAQNIKDVLLDVQGDWFLNLDQGLPFFQTILKKATTISAVEAIYLDAITSVTGVLDLQEFRLDFEPSTRTASITFTALTTDGILNYNLEL